MFYKGTSKLRTTHQPSYPTETASDHIRVVGYVRVSTDMQVNEGVSLDAQSEKIKAYCKLHGVELIGIYKDEGLSAKSLERPGLKSALAMLERGKANTLLVVKLDRLTRSLLDLDALIRGYFTKERYHLLSVSESLDTRTAMGRFVLYILGLIAQWEREAIAERTREALAHLRQQGVPLGAAPYGYARSAEPDEAGRKHFVAVPEEMLVIARILRLFDVGTSARRIAALLNEERVAAPRGCSQSYFLDATIAGVPPALTHWSWDANPVEAPQRRQNSALCSDDALRGRTGAHHGFQGACVNCSKRRQHLNSLSLHEAASSRPQCARKLLLHKARSPPMVDELPAHTTANPSGPRPRSNHTNPQRHHPTPSDITAQSPSRST